MDAETRQLVDDLQEALSRAKDYSKVSIHDVFLDAEAIIATMSYIIKPMFELENQYRNIIANKVLQGDSNAKAESLAKASEIYRDWRYISEMYELSKEQVMLLKKFKTELEGEFTSRTKL